MTIGHTTHVERLVLAALLLLLSACGTTAPTRFYLLHPASDVAPASTSRLPEDVTLVISPVSLPEHLNRSQIVSRQEGHRVTVDEFNRWAEPLDANFTRMLAENLAGMLGSDRIFVLNRFKFPQYDYRISLNIQRFDGQVGKDVHLVCRWAIDGGDENASNFLRRTAITRKVTGDGYEGLVDAMSRALADLSREIAAQIKEWIVL
jgi:uncharacterized lipoprotein YmbA